VRLSWNLPKTKKQQGNIDVFVHCGFVVNSRFPWLGASPDCLVFDGAEANSFGIGEVKCPFSKKDMTVDEACKDKNFCLQKLTAWEDPVKKITQLFLPNSTVYGHTECQLV
jgi:hypothetical protein